MSQQTNDEVAHTGSSATASLTHGGKEGEGVAVAMPSVRLSSVEDAKVAKMREGSTKYGGKGDKAHLGE